MQAVRVLLELAGVAAVLVGGYLLLLVHGLATGLRGVDGTAHAWSVALGYVVLAAVFLAGGRLLPRVPLRARFDLWLVAFVLAALATALLVRNEWPTSFPAPGHGLANGGEPNALAQPWLHLALWWLLGRACSERSVPRAPGSSSGSPAGAER